MIVCALEPMNPDVEKRLRIWLAKEEMQQLVRSAESQGKSLASKAISELLAADDFPDKREAGKETLRKAQKYVTFLEVLKQLTSQTEPHMVCKLT